MFWFAYNVMFVVGYALMLPYFLFRMWRRGGYAAGFGQRLGILGRELKRRLRERDRIWIHAVSVGEVGVALRFMEEFSAAEPEACFLLTTTTSTGHAVAVRRARPQDAIAYFPLDLPVIVRSVLSAVRPMAMILVEGELWPNLIRICAARGIPVMLINGRMSEKSRRGYGIMGCFFRRAMALMDLICVQSEEESRRFTGLGTPPDIIRVTGSAKYDITAADGTRLAAASAILAKAGIKQGDPILVGGSTWRGEEEILAEVCGRMKPSFPDLRLVLAPRHVERAEEVAKMLRGRGVSFVRRSRIDEAPPSDGPSDVVLVDSTGELAGFYGAASVVFVGKSLTAHGGQNVIEPALMGKAIIVGPHTENFEAIVADFVRREAILQAPDAQGLERQLRMLLSDPKAAGRYGERARETAMARRGAVAAMAKEVRELLGRKKNRPSR